MALLISTRSRPALLASSFLLLFALNGLGPSAAGQSLRDEYRVKAVFLYHFVQFVEWPESAFENSQSPWIVGVLGTDPFGGELERTFRNERVDGRHFEVRPFRRVSEIGPCHLLYVSRSEEKRLASILDELRDRSILTVGETEAFLRHGGVVRFLVQDNRVRLQVNLDAAEQADLQFSSKLLRVSETVRMEPKRP